MKIKLLCFLVFFYLQLSSVAQPWCTLPINLKSTTLSYIRLPGNDAASNDTRFLYQTVVECGQSNTNELHDLYILNKIDPKTIAVGSWKVDSFNKITSVIDPCLELPSAPCYSVYYYHADVYLGGLGYAPQGYLANTINCCHPGNAQNLKFAPDNMDLENEPPPNRSLPCGPQEYPNLWFPATISNGLVSFISVPPLTISNNSPRFSNSDTILYICQNRTFSYQLRASDPDGDSIAYHFSQPRSFFSTQFSSYRFTSFPPLSFASGFSLQAPAGPNVVIDERSGLISGEISDTGTYAITISVPEYRNGQLLDSVINDLYIRVYDCSLLPKPKADIPDTLNSCSDFTVLFPNNSYPIYKNINYTNTSFLWNFGDGGTSNQVYPSHTYTDTGTYKIRLIVFPGLYCADTAYSKIFMYPFVNSSFTYSDSCNGHQILFTNTSSSSSGIITSALWKIQEDSNTLYSSDQNNIKYTFQKAPQTYSVALTVINDKGCVATDTKFINISNSPSPLVSHDTLLARGANLQLEADDGNFGSGGSFFWWPSYGLNDISIVDPVLTSTTDTTYYVFIKNRFGCVLQDSISVKYYAGPDIYVPNAFTPNGDGRNDIFRAVPVGISKMNYFKVYNRNGQLVFQTTQAGQGWDGTIRGLPSAEDTYVWEVRGIDYSGKTISKKGTVVLVR